jgi:transcriptional regulator with XRE-family HTH domain
MSVNPSSSNQEVSTSRLGMSKGTADSVSEFTKRIEFRMRELGMTKKDLAEKAGISRQSLYSILQLGTEGDPAMPKIKTMLALADALKMHPFWLVDGLFCNVYVPPSVDEQVKGDRAGFVYDLSYPDGSLVAPGQHFVKKWLLQNVGDVAWLKDSRKLVCWDEEIVVTSKRTGTLLHVAGRLTPDAEEIQLPSDIAAGGVFEMSMGFTAPKTNGMVMSYWVPVNTDGSLCYGESTGIWCMVRVSEFADTIAFKPYR